MITIPLQLTLSLGVIYKEARRENNAGKDWAEAPDYYAKKDIYFFASECR